uniref:Mediator of RNA polymerase II transcription subunit 7 n=1 Tax=Aceria tosichella TaxID=561515 RepID=A0A6G1SJM9_9ACAR
MASSSSSSTELQQQQQQQQQPQQQQPSTVLTYPLPPLQYINNIDPENLPAPPAPITEGIYYMFGQKISLDDAIIAPLEAHGTKRLFPRTEYDHKKELKKINASILVNFLDLIDVLVKCPDTDKRIEKCNDLATLFINFHHLINELRPHQARETLRVWLTAQKRTREEITKKLNAEMEKMSKVLDQYHEFEQTNKFSAQRQSDTKPDDTNQSNTNQTPASVATPSIDDIMCELVDETSLK